jgi:hypothetical protein
MPSDVTVMSTLKMPKSSSAGAFINDAPGKRLVRCRNGLRFVNVGCTGTRSFSKVGSNSSGSALDMLVRATGHHSEPFSS